jgi:hypothetical protein
MNAVWAVSITLLSWDEGKLPAAESPHGDLYPRRRYALLESNKVVTGLIQEKGDSYVIERGGASVTLPRRQVPFIGDSLESIFEFRSSRIPPGDLEMRAELAEWCLREGLPQEAVTEAQRIVNIDRSNVVAQRVLKMSEPKRTPGEEGGLASSSKRRPRQPSPTRVISHFKSAYGQELFNRFKEFEPLLMASCGNAACHGGMRHEGSFRLYRRTNGATADVSLTSRNLMSLLDSIDFEDPIRSPLLYKSLERHGASSLPPLGGVQDPTYVALQEWVVEVSHRWAGNDVELTEPVPEETVTPAEAEDPESFAAARPQRTTTTRVVKRTGRPQRPGSSPADEMESIPGQPMLADDAPADLTGFEELNSDVGAETMRAEDIARPIEPSAAPVSTRPRGFRGAVSRFVEMVGGRPRVKPSIALPSGGVQPPGVAAGETFEAATPPLNLQNLPMPVDE